VKEYIACGLAYAAKDESRMNVQMGDVRRIRKRSEQKDVDFPREPPPSFFSRVKLSLAQTLPVSNSVDINDLGSYAPVLALLNILIWLTLFLYLLIATTHRELKSSFIALTPPPASDAACENVPVSISGTFRADGQGQWSTSKSFDNEALYELSMTGTTVTLDAYVDTMAIFRKSFVDLGTRMMRFDIISAQIAWSLLLDTNSSTLMTFQAYAQLNQLFKANFKSGLPVLSSAQGICQNLQMNLPPTFNDETMTLSVVFPALPPTSSPTQHPTVESKGGGPPSPAPTPSSEPIQDYFNFCPEQLSILNGTFSLVLSRTHFGLDLDLSSLMAAFALNMGLVGPEALTLLEEKTIENMEGGLGNVRVTTYVSDRYVNMHRVECYTPQLKPRVCFGQASAKTLVYPIFTSTQGAVAPGQPCLCPRDAKNAECNSLSDTFEMPTMLMSLVYARNSIYLSQSPLWTDSLVDMIRMGVKLQKIIKDDPVDGPNRVKATVANLGYIAQFFAPYAGGENQYDEWRSGVAVYIDGGAVSGNVTSFAEYQRSFIDLGDNMAILSFSIEYPGSAAMLNTMGVSLDSLHNSSSVTCSNTVDEEALQRLVESPPINVTQPWVSCRPTPLNAFITAAGIAAANSSLVSTLFLGAAVSLVVLWISRVHEEKRFMPPHKKAAQAALKDAREKEELFARVAALESALLSRSARLSPGLDAVPPPLPPQNPIQR
jgi:hypothetical protein